MDLHHALGHYRDYRFATINGVKLALPRVGTRPDDQDPYEWGTLPDGWGDDSEFRDMLDHVNFDVPPGWAAGTYWSSTEVLNQGHYYVEFSAELATYENDGVTSWVALQVL